MQITHEEAHRLIQFSMDQELKPQERNRLQSHLEICLECRSFDEDLKEVNKLLLPMMRKHWDLRPIPLSVGTLKSKRKFHLPTSNLLVTRTAVISLALVAFIFSAWQFTRSNNQTVTPIPLGVLPITTPSGESTSTMVSLQNCVEMRYRVQENDTLESIASQFSVSREQIVAINHLSTESINTNLELLIPVCVSTPTGTIYPATLRATFTPVLGSTTSAPGG
jgi:predicted anti-sigma-YlaC factor YlaD